MFFHLKTDWARRLPGRRRWFSLENCAAADYRGWAYIAITFCGVSLVLYAVRPKQATLIWSVLCALGACLVGNTLALLVWLLI